MKNLNLFLKESNIIEGVLDDDSLQQAHFAWILLKWQKEISSGLILQAHKILMENQDLKPSEKGRFRTCQVWVGGRKCHRWESIPLEIETWCVNANVEPTDWKASHITFEKIHPFVDGNGRIGRILMNWQRRKAGLPIKVIKAAERNKYYAWFR